MADRLDAYAEAAYDLRCKLMAAAKERPPETGSWADRAEFLRGIDREVAALVGGMAVRDAAMDLAAADHAATLSRAGEVIAGLRDRVRRLEAKVSQIEGCADQWKLLVGDDPGALADAILAIIGSDTGDLAEGLRQ